MFLHSLIGRAEGLGSDRFGLLRQDALLEVDDPDRDCPFLQAVDPDAESR